MSDPRPAECLRATMLAHKLTRPQVAALCGVALSTVGSWLAPPEANRHREMPARHLTMLELRLALTDPD